MHRTIGLLSVFHRYWESRKLIIRVNDSRSKVFWNINNIILWSNIWFNLSHQVMSDWFMRTWCLIRHVVYCDLVSGVLTGKILCLVWILQQVMRKSRTQVCSRDVSLSLESSLCLFLYLLDSALCVTSSLMSLTPSLISRFRCLSESRLKSPPRLLKIIMGQKWSRKDSRTSLEVHTLNALIFVDHVFAKLPLVLFNVTKISWNKTFL